MEEEATCPVCLDFFKDPYMLKCSHNLCKACCEALIKSKKSSDIECPMCRSLTPQGRLLENRALRNMVELLKTLKFSSTPQQPQDQQQTTVALVEDTSSASKSLEPNPNPQIIKVLVKFPKIYQSALLENNCATLKQLSQQTHTEIKFPKKPTNASPAKLKHLEEKVVVKGKHEDILRAQTVLKRYLKELKSKRESASLIRVSLPIPKELQPLVIGENGVQIKEIQNATKCKITFPTAEHSSSMAIIIEGKDHESVGTAEELLKEAAMAAKEKLQQQQFKLEEARRSRMRLIEEEVRLEERTRQNPECLIM